MIKLVDKSDVAKYKVCCNCKKNFTYIDTRGYEDWRTCDCKKEGCTGYLCKKCHMKQYTKEHDKDPNSSHNIVKSMMKWINGQLTKGSEKGKGFRIEQVLAIYLGKKNCNLENNNFNNRGFDLEGRIGVMSRKPYYREVE